MLLGLPIALWWIFLAVALILADMFMLGGQFILVVAAVAALVAATMAWLGTSIGAQVWLFIISSVVLTPALMIALKVRHRNNKPGPLEQNWARGATIQTYERNDRIVAKLKGDEYPVVLLDGTKPSAGTDLIVDRMNGITLEARHPE